MEATVIAALITGAVSIVCALIAANVASAKTAQKMSEQIVVLENTVKQFEKLLNKLEAKLDNATSESGELAKKYERLEVRVETLEREMKEAKQHFS
jgi:peptidoglycan hydrolase CwlO-like protein